MSRLRLVRIIAVPPRIQLYQRLAWKVWAHLPLRLGFGGAPHSSQRPLGRALCFSYSTLHPGCDRPKMGIWDPRSGLFTVLLVGAGSNHFCKVLAVCLRGIISVSTTHRLHRYRVSIRISQTASRVFLATRVRAEQLDGRYDRLQEISWPVSLR